MKNITEQEALQRLKDFEEHYPGIVKLCKRMDEYNHLKAELAMAKLNIGISTHSNGEGEVRDV